MPETPAWLMDGAAAYDAMRDAAIDRAAAALLSSDVAASAAILRERRALDGDTGGVDTFTHADNRAAEEAP